MYQLLASLFVCLVFGCDGTSVGSESPQPEAQSAQDSTTTTAASDESLPTVGLSRAFPRLTFTRPVYLTHAGDSTNRLFVIDQRGRILVFENRSDVAQAKEFLDIRANVNSRNNEEGLLALAFHPRYADNGQFYVYYTASDPRRGVLSRFTVSADDPDLADPSSEQVILEVEQPYGNHNGATVLFGQDGYLYISLGDGGYANDPHNNGQDLSTLLGTILRIDVDQRDDDRNYAIPKDNPFVNRPEARGKILTVLFGQDGYLYISLGDGGYANDPHNNGQDLSTLLGTILRIDVDQRDDDRNYAIPKDNPFVNRPEARGEIWAYGLRNVWRMSFDRQTGDLWAGDIGQNKWEEIDLIVKGGNYGWNIREGNHDFKPRESAEPLIDPVAEYPRGDGLSVTGGYVYRGDRIPQLRGAYIYTDYVSGKIWALRYRDGEVTAHREISSGQRRTYITSFGEGPDGELYLCAFDSLDGRGGSTGRIYRLDAR